MKRTFDVKTPHSSHVHRGGAPGIQDGSTAGRDLRSYDGGGVPTVFRSERGLTFAISAKADQASLLTVAQTVSRKLEAEPEDVRPRP